MDNQKQNILSQAEEIIYGDRERVYGNPAKNFTTIAGFWSHYLYSKFGVDLPLDCNDICILMTLLKLSRLVNSPEHKDSQIDVCGYTASMERVQNYLKGESTHEVRHSIHYSDTDRNKPLAHSVKEQSVFPNPEERN